MVRHSRCFYCDKLPAMCIGADKKPPFCPSKIRATTSSEVTTALATLEHKKVYEQELFSDDSGDDEVRALDQDQDQVTALDVSTQVKVLERRPLKFSKEEMNELFGDDFFDC